MSVVVRLRSRSHNTASDTHSDLWQVSHSFPSLILSQHKILTAAGCFVRGGNIREKGLLLGCCSSLRGFQAKRRSNTWANSKALLGLIFFPLGKNRGKVGPCVPSSHMCQVYFARRHAFWPVCLVFLQGGESNYVGRSETPVGWYVLIVQLVIFMEGLLAFWLLCVVVYYPLLCCGRMDIHPPKVESTLCIIYKLK